MKLKVFTLIAAILAVILISPPVRSQTAAPDTSTVAVKVVQAPATSASDVKADSVTLQTSQGAQTVPANTVTAPSKLTFFGITLPAWVLTLITAILAVLPAIQLVLKMVPGATPIGGVLGAILNFFTAFQKNLTTTSSSNTTT